MKITQAIIICLLVTVFISGCSIEQNLEHGANSDRTEGFSGYGTMRVRYMEGPLSDMMVPDNVPMGRADSSKIVAEENVLLSGERNLSFSNQGINRNGARILSNRPGTLHDKYFLREKPQMTKRTAHHSLPNGSKEQRIQQQIQSLETIENVFVVTSGQRTLIGVQSQEPNRHKLQREIRNELQEHGLVDVNNLYIATDRRNVNRIRSLQGARGPIDQIGTAFSDIFNNLQPVR